VEDGKLRSRLDCERGEEEDNSFEATADRFSAGSSEACRPIYGLADTRLRYLTLTHATRTKSDM